MTDITRLAAALSERYALERELGAGGMATVYLARDLKHDRKVALKVLRPELAAVIGAERFLAEIKTTANLQHPHILPLHDSGQVDGTVFYVMPLVEGESLRDRLTREKQLPVADAVRIATEVAGALDYAHRHGVIHRDIKPENILLHDGQALIADFGIALAASNTSNTRMTETGMSLGTPHYMSPEQAMGERNIDARSDVYSLGAVLYEMLTGDPPHTGSTVQAIVAKVLSEPPTPISRTRSMVPPNVDAVVQKALAKTPADRFQSAAEFSAALANPSFMLGAASGGAAAAAARTSVWNPVSIGATAAAATLLAIMLISGKRPAADANGATSRQRIVLRRGELDNMQANLRAEFSPDASVIVYRDTIGGVTRLWMKPRGEKDAVLVAGTDAASGAAFSPDGKSIVFAAGDKLKKVPSNGGAALPIAELVNTQYPFAVWMDDSTVAYVAGNFSVISVPAVGGKTTVITGPADTAFALGAVALTPLPQSRGLLVTACTPGCGQYSVWSVDAKTHAVKLLAEDALKAWYVSSGHIVYVRRDGGVFAARFDMKTLTLATAAVPVFDGVRSNSGIPDIAISPRGDVLYIAGTAGGSDAFEIVWVSRDGKATPVDTSWRMGPGSNSGLALSRDGTKLAVNIQGKQSGDIWVKQLNAGPLTRITTDGLRNFRPSWTPDGKYLTYMSDRAGPAYAIYRSRADGSGAPELMLAIPKTPITEATQSRDGTWIVMRTGGVAGQAGGRDIVGIRPGIDSTPKPLIVQEKFDSKVVALSPDAKWLAYESTESGKEEIYVRPFPNVNEGKVQVSAHGGFGPLWAHSGKELFYLNGALEMVAVTIRPGPTFGVAAERVLFPTAVGYYRALNYRQYDISPDGQRFIMMRRAQFAGGQRPAADLILIENWLTELKAKVGK